MAPHARFAETLEFALYRQRRIEDVLSCLNCGRRSAATDRFCTSCGTGLDQSTARSPSRARSVTPTLQLRAIRSVPCPHCARSIDRDAPFCPHCGLRVLGEPGSQLGAVACSTCGALRSRTDALFCGSCGTPAARRPTPSAIETAPRAVMTPTAERGSARLAILDASGDVTELVPSTLQLAAGAGSSSRGDAVRISPLGRYGSTFLFISEPHTLVDGDQLLVGSQVVRFRLLDPPRPSPMPRVSAEARVLTAQPLRDVAVLEQLRPDGSVRDVLHVQEGRRILMGRETGDWTFAYDRTVSARHCEITPSPDGWVVRDLGSRNGTGVAVRGQRLVHAGERLLVGGQMLRVEYA